MMIRHEELSREASVKKSVALFTLIASSFAVSAYAADSSVTGWISDSMCGAKHAGTGSACVKQCIKGGMKPVFVDEGKKAVWSIDNPDSVKSSFYGEKVTIHATTDAANKSVHISSVEAAK
jgi:hypothetical protein